MRVPGPAPTTAPRPGFSLRAATAQDLDLSHEITREAMRAYVEQTWGVWREDEQRAKHRLNFTPGTHRIVLVGAQPVGVLAVEEEAAHLWLVKVYLRPGAQGMGLGSRLVRQVIDEADRMHKPVRLRVLRVNRRAKALYERLGFEVVGEAPERFFMLRPRAAA